MGLHRMNSVTLGVPDVEKSIEFYRDFNLSETSPGVFATVDGGDQLKLVHSPLRRLVELNVGAESPDDVGRVESQLSSLDVEVERTELGIGATDPGTGVRVCVDVSPPLAQEPVPATPYNGPGREDRVGRSPRLVGEGVAKKEAHPRKLGHVVLGTTELDASRRFFMDGIGFKLSDEIKGAASFLRCSTDHHNLLVQRAPVQFLHHTSWQLDDVDAIGLGAQAVLKNDPTRHTWGFGRHHVGSNFFWYFRDPAGNFCEYYADMDVIVDDQLWEPQVFEGAQTLYSWGPPPPPSFLRPDDLTELMAGLHSSKG